MRRQYAVIGDDVNGVARRAHSLLRQKPYRRPEKMPALLISSHFILMAKPYGNHIAAKSAHVGHAINMQRQYDWQWRYIRRRRASSSRRNRYQINMTCLALNAVAGV